ncbi:geranylgeranylglycerol-phosphate geranylgeranyltransferase [Flavobacterium sp. xlx-214]|uniref:geranylgeranylglycerol-phosphate geranylgeranyltransferase n=1 Tax=unclassified Flavobacterium TaxID=196869 RepID=UPI0013D2B326|nr:MULTISPECIES: geranylgeranylglycerol-phosphate geranylgeranyltransferase [unclassified Flavobacterium]MBA5792334.1 geranylgeranylglycerol-phosphate geranylgeranyltransferase [Flavobacterium sp. xlx-221]QMI82351.1 geranylgeranylglycerol-phosphate geranylgeranyltransferase [Flavobacterium sp. xlx-214]
MATSRQLKRTLLKIFSFFSVIRGYNIIVVILAQYFSAIFIFGSHLRAITVLKDFNLFLIILSSALAIASGYIINNFYDTEKDLINRPNKSQLDKLVSKNTQLRTYFALNFTSACLAWLVSWRAVAFYAVYIFLLWFYSHKIKKNYPIVGNITASLLVLLPFFGILMHFANFSWGIFAHAFYLYLILLIREFVKDLENIKGDFANNYQTVPVRFGAKTSKYIISFLTLLTLVPAYLLIWYYEVGYMQYYFYVSSGLLLAFVIFLFDAQTQTDFKKLHILLKLIIILGVLSIVLIDPNVIINGKKLVTPYL